MSPALNGYIALQTQLCVVQLKYTCEVPGRNQEHYSAMYNVFRLITVFEAL